MTYDQFKQAHQARLSKARKPIEHPEDELQIQCVKWFKEEGYPDLAPLLFHPNNEPYLGRGKTIEQKARAGARLKQMGVTAGVADLILLCPGTQHHALCVELKSKTGSQSDSQRQWQKEVTQHGIKYIVCRSLDHFKAITEEYLGISPNDPTQAAIDRIFGPGFKAKIHKSE